MGGPKWPCVNHVFDWCFCHFWFFGLEHHFGAICLMCTLLPMCVATCTYVFGHVQVYMLSMCWAMCVHMFGHVCVSRWLKWPMCSMCIGPCVACVACVQCVQGHV